MDNTEAIKSFRRVYSEDEASILKVTDTKTDNKIITAQFNDGIFYFVVGKDTVSASYNTKMDALKHV